MIENLNPVRFANVVMQLESSFPGSFLLVEGYTDFHFFSKFSDKENTKIEICFGRDNITEAVQILNERGFNRHLGIRDADFGYLTENDDVENLLITDDSDIEIMIFNSPAFETLIRLLGSSQKIDQIEKQMGITTRDLIFQILKPLGCLRFLNYNESLGLKFKSKDSNSPELKYSRFICPKKFEFLGVNILVQTIIEYSRGEGKKLPNFDIVVSKVEELQKMEFNLSHLINGHDLCFALALSLERVCGSSKDYNAQSIRNALILAYESRYFIKTNLYNSICEWEKEHYPNRILAIES